MPEKKFKVAIIIPYFGKFPEWIDLFFYTCHRNQFISPNITIDWFIFTDNYNTTCKYTNVNISYMAFEDYCEVVSNSLNMKFSPLKPYKLCDLKPFYGVIHKSVLVNYTHWGFGDLDLCYGKLSLIINERNLSRYSLITSHADRIAGHFTIIKYESEYTNMCFKILDWEKKLLSDKILGLDELDLSILVRKSFVNWWRVYRYFFKPFKFGMYNFMRIPNWLHNLYSNSLIREFYTSPLPKDGEHWILDIDSNKIINPLGREIPYLHFIFFKKTPFLETPNYWKPGFYHLEKETFSRNDGGKIIFDNNTVKYKK